MKNSRVTTVKGKVVLGGWAGAKAGAETGDEAGIDA
jgi:hypothetical protein